MALIEVLGYGALFMLLLCGNLGIMEAFTQQKKHCRKGNSEQCNKEKYPRIV